MCRNLPRAYDEREPEIDFGPELVDPRDTLDALFALYGVEYTAVAFADALTRHREILNEAAEEVRS